jgi:hypothetical protein
MKLADCVVGFKEEKYTPFDNGGIERGRAMAPSLSNILRIMVTMEKLPLWVTRPIGGNKMTFSHVVNTIYLYSSHKMSSCSAHDFVN